MDLTSQHTAHALQSRVPFGFVYPEVLAYCQLCQLQLKPFGQGWKNLVCVLVYTCWRADVYSVGLQVQGHALNSVSQYLHACYSFQGVSHLCFHCLFSLFFHRCSLVLNFLLKCVPSFFLFFLNFCSTLPLLLLHLHLLPYQTTGFTSSVFHKVSINYILVVIATVCFLFCLVSCFLSYSRALDSKITKTGYM